MIEPLSRCWQTVLGSLLVFSRRTHMLSLCKAFIGVVYLEDLDMDRFILQILPTFKCLAKVDGKEHKLQICGPFASYSQKICFY